MNDRIAQMAREADPGFGNDDGDMPEAIVGKEAIARFARLVAEDCAKFVDPDSEHRKYPNEYLGGKEGIELLDGVAAAIRARYSKE